MRPGNPECEHLPGRNGEVPQQCNQQVQQCGPDSIARQPGLTGTLFSDEPGTSYLS